MIAVLGSAGIATFITICAIWHWREIFIVRTPRKPDEKDTNW